MTTTRIMPSGLRSTATFTPRHLREELDAFVPGEQTLCGPTIQAYLDYYALHAVADLAGYSIGIELVGDTQLVVQHFHRAHSRGTVILVHGYTDHAALYRHLVQHLLEQRWDVLMYDLPGHGLSGGQRLAIDSFDTYARQLASILRRHQSRLQAPWVGIGQSTGSAIWLQAELNRQLHQLPVEDRILLSPLVRPQHFNRVERIYRWFHWCLKRVHREPTLCSNDTDFSRFLRYSDPLKEHFVDVGWVGAMLQWVELVEAATGLNLPALVMQGTDDATLEWAHNLEVLARLLPQASIEQLAGARHQLANEAEPWRQEVFARISDRLRPLAQGLPLAKGA